MTEQPGEEITCVARGTLIEVELWEDLLTEAGIQCKVVGAELTAGLGTAIPGSVELWVHERDVARAEDVIRYAEEHKGESERSRPPSGPVESDRRPGSNDPRQGHPTSPRYRREPGDRPAGPGG